MFTHARSLLLVMTTFVGLTACGSCGGKRSSGTNFSGVTATTTPAPATPAPAGPAPAPFNPSVGQAVPPITSTSVTTIDTTTAAAVDHLIVNSTAEQDVGRYLSEFLIIVRGKQESCIRLKVRPTAGIETSVATSATTGVSGSAPCTEQAVSDTSDAATATGTGTGTGTAVSSSTSTSKATLALTDGKTYMTNGEGFSLDAASAALCSPRLFRMQSAQSAQTGTLSPVNEKSGRLMVIGKKVRIWLDEEYANPCTGGTALDARAPTKYGLLEQIGAVKVGDGDMLWTEQLQNMADEMDTVYGDMTTQFGAVSDVDGNGFVEIFISPDVNRFYFINYLVSDIDHFRANPIYRPQDLAFYDPTTNPISNEGEILYMWAPDPAGIYNQESFPSSNSLTSNYGKGYLASQLMTLIIENQRLIVQGAGSITDQWLVSSLANLASAYYAGNDYSFYALIQYLTSHSQYVPLDQPLDTSFFSSNYIPFANDEMLGMQTIFGWYLHTRLCGGTTASNTPNVAPCAKLAGLYNTKATGTAAIAALLGGGESWDTTIENFGLSVGISLLHNPKAATSIWTGANPPAGLPKAPFILPDLAPIAQARATVEEDNIGSTLRTASGSSSTTIADVTQAGPFPSKRMLLFQPLTSDSDMEFKVAQDGVAYILVTSLIEQQTDITAAIGQGLNVVIAPAGDRDPNVRRVHMKKVSEDARSDFRPDNLTSLQDQTTTYNYPPMYASADFTVTEEREDWAFGSIDNFQENIGGSEVTLGGMEAFEVPFNPCLGLTGAALTTCQGTAHTGIIQVLSRDYDLLLNPMLVVTAPKREMFRGAGIHGLVDDIYPGFVTPTNHLAVICESAVESAAATSVTFDEASGTVLAAANTLSVGQPVAFYAASLPTNVYPDYPYVVAAGSTSSALKLKDTYGGLITFPGATQYPAMMYAGQPVSFTVANDTVTANGHLLQTNQKVSFFGSNLPTGVSQSTAYLATNVTINTFQITDTSGNLITFSGASPTGYMFLSNSQSAVASCANAGQPNSFFYDNRLTASNANAFAPIWDNFLDSNPLEYPFSTINTEVYTTQPECDGPHCYQPWEAQRENLVFAVSAAILPTSYDFYAGSVNYPYSEYQQKVPLTPSLVGTMLSLKQTMDTCNSADLSTNSLFMSQCGLFNLSVAQCTNFCASQHPSNVASVQAGITTYMSQTASILVCPDGADCSTYLSLTQPGTYTAAWIPLSQYAFYASASESIVTFYNPVVTVDRHSYCSGDPVGTGGTQVGACEIRKGNLAATPTDIRQQIFAPASMVSGSIRTNPDGSIVKNLDGTPTTSSCDENSVVGRDTMVCIDPISVYLELNSSLPYVFMFDYLPLATDLSRLRRPAPDALPIANRAGELTGKPERIQSVKFSVPAGDGTAATTQILNVIVGGRKQSQGKFLIRARFYN